MNAMMMTRPCPVKVFCRILPIILFSLLAAGSAQAHILEVATGKVVKLSEMFDDLGRVRVVFVGEEHQKVGHHRAQFQVIKGLEESGKEVAVGLEMFRTDYQQALDDWVAGKLPTREFANIHNLNWSMWGLYAGIYMYARDEEIPLVALNISRDITRLVARNGFASLSERQLEELPPVQCRVDPAYMAFIRRALGGHELGDMQFKNFCEAQLLWDKVMARNLKNYLDTHPETIVVVLAGSAHSWKHGIPNQLKAISDIPYRVLLPEMPGRLDEDNVTTNDADYLMLGVGEAPLH